MNEASRVQKLLIDQNNEINRLRNRIEQLEAALREIAALGFWDGDRAMDIARKTLEDNKDET